MQNFEIVSRGRHVAGAWYHGFRNMKHCGPESP